MWPAIRGMGRPNKHGSGRDTSETLQVAQCNAVGVAAGRGRAAPPCNCRYPGRTARVLQIESRARELSGDANTQARARLE